MNKYCLAAPSVCVGGGGARDRGCLAIAARASPASRFSSRWRVPVEQRLARQAGRDAGSAQHSADGLGADTRWPLSHRAEWRLPAALAERPRYERRPRDRTHAGSRRMARPGARAERAHAVGGRRIEGVDLRILGRRERRPEVCSHLRAGEGSRPDARRISSATSPCRRTGTCCTPAISTTTRSWW